MKKHKSQILSIIFMIIIGLGISSVAIANTPIEIQVVVNNDVINLETKSQTVESVLTGISYNINGEYKMNKRLDDIIEDGDIINIEEPKTININYANNIVNIATYEKTVKDALKDANLEIDEYDIVIPSLDTRIRDGDFIKVDKVTFKKISHEIEVDYDEKVIPSYKLELDKTKLKEKGRKGVKALTYKETYINGIKVSVELVDEEVVKKPKTEIIEYGLKEEKERDVDYKTKIEYDNSKKKGTSFVKQEGKKGKKILTYNYDKKRIKDKENNSKKLIKEKITVPARDKIIVKGTKVNTLPAKKFNTKNFTNAGTRIMHATAYSTDPAENGGWSVTALGTPLRRGVCAVDPSVIPLGTNLYVEGYGYCRAEDTGGAIKGNKIDVLIPNKSEVYRWGRRNVKVTILK